MEKLSVVLAPQIKIDVPDWPEFQEIIKKESLATALNSAKYDILLILSPDVKFKNSAKELYRVKNADLVFSDYIENGQPISLFPDIGDITERFKMGYLIFISRETLARIGGAKDYRYATLYDLRLKFQEIGASIVHISEPLYEIERKEENNIKKLTYSDSFEYLFYGPDAQREYEKVFKDMLKRRNALLDGSYESFYRKINWPVMVSVIIPVKNREKFIGKALESLLMQTFRDFEAIVVDGGSKDKTPEIVKKFTEKDKRIKLLRKPPGNIAEAINFGLKKAQGKYIAQLDSDDFYEPDTLKTMVESMEKEKDAGLAISYYRIVDPDGNPLPLKPIKHLEYDRNNILRVDGAGALRFFRHEVFLNLGYFNEKEFGDYAEDYDMILRISEHYRIIRVHKILYNYRRHPGSTDAKREPFAKYFKKTLIRQIALQRRKNLNFVKRLSRGLTSYTS